MDYVLETRGLSKSYGRFKALNGLNMHVPRGAIYGLVGKNGAGKTTLMRIICGLQEPCSGSYSLYGVENGGRVSRARRRMGAVVESPAIYLDMSARDNLRQQYKILGLPSFEGIDELLSLVGLENTGRKKAGHFSLGMKQRLGIALALAGDPDFLALDEPVNGLDPQGIIDIRELILKLNRERDITVLISSHNLDELARVATHYGFVDGGRMVKELSAKQLQASCRKCLRAVVSDVRPLALVLDRLGFEYEVVSSTQADIFASPNISLLAGELMKENCELIAIQERDEDLESYYVNLVGGVGND